MSTPVVPEQFSARLVRELKGAPLACFMLLLLSGSPVSNEWLCRMSGYTDKPVAQALKLLSGAEYQIARRSRGGWLLSQTFQFVLGQEESRKNSVPTTTTLVNTEILKEEVVVVSRKNSDSVRESAYNANLAVCKELGIGEPNASTISDLEYVTPDFIRAHVQGLKKGETRGLAIVRIRNNELPFVADEQLAEVELTPLEKKIAMLRQREDVAVETEESYASAG
jgi:hypothetical protein